MRRLPRSARGTSAGERVRDLTNTRGRATLYLVMNGTELEAAFEAARVAHPDAWDSAMENSAELGFAPYGEDEMRFVVRSVAAAVEVG